MSGHVYLHRGQHFLNEIKAAGLRLDVVVDVGAHRGESIAEFLAASPEARILAFEPIAENRATIAGLLAGMAPRAPSVRLLDWALSDEDGESRFALHGSGSHVLKPDEREDASTTTVRRTTLDRVIAEEAVDQVDLLKIDVEGHELQVLRGAVETLRAGRVSLVNVEVGLHRDNRHHTPFGAVDDFLRTHDFELFGFYEQINEFLFHKLFLRRANVAYIHRSRAELRR